MTQKPEFATKRIEGVDYPASSFLVVDKYGLPPESWMYPVKSPTGQPDPALMEKAWKELSGGDPSILDSLRHLFEEAGLEIPAEPQMEEQEDLPADPVPGSEEVQEVGRRLQGKQLAALRAAGEAITNLLQWAEYGDQEDDETEEQSPTAEVHEALQSLSARLSDIMGAFMRLYWEEGEPSPEFWPMDVLEGHPQLGNAVVARSEEGLYYAIPYVAEEGQPVSFGMPPWSTVVPSYVQVGLSEPPEEEPEPGEPEENQSDPPPVVEAEVPPDPSPEPIQAEEGLLGETVPPQVESPIEPPAEVEMLETETLAESESMILEARSSPNGVPLAMDVVLIQPGWGNSRDNHYYSAEMLRRDASVFEGAKMFETDHNQSEKNTRTWVSTVEKIKGFTETGAPIARVVVHDPGFATRVKALEEAGMLSRMECSILAVGQASKGKAPDGKVGKIVEKITDALAVDWVTRAGAGGQAVALTETEPIPGSDSISEVVPAAPTPVILSAREILQICETRPGLPIALRDRIVSGRFQTADEVWEAIRAEISYLKAATGSGSPFERVQASEAAGNIRKMTPDEYEARMAQILSKYSS